MSIFKIKSLPPHIKNIIINKATEQAFTGEYTDKEAPGSYLCRLCGVTLFRSNQKFHSSCGWPSFDDEFEKSIKKISDADGRRTEILCHNCDAHLGHIFTGEENTAKNTRYCVNSLSLDFVEDLQVKRTAELIIAAGCFWGVEHYFKKYPGVIKTEVGYSGGVTSYPNYEEICAGQTKHLEVLRVLYDVSKTNYEALIHYFFEIHNFSQEGGQGPDIGSQYLSAIFYNDENELKIVQKVIKELQEKNYYVATKILPTHIFWKAEEYHQDYYNKTGKEPYCHVYKKIF